MSSLENARNVPQTARRTVATASARPRVPSSRVGASESPNLDSEVRPQDSVSNAPSRKTTSASLKTNGSRRSFEEKRTERTHITTKDTVHIRTKKSTKPIVEDRASSVTKTIDGKKDLRRAKAVDIEDTRRGEGKDALG